MIKQPEFKRALTRFQGNLSVLAKNCQQELNVGGFPRQYAERLTNIVKEASKLNDWAEKNIRESFAITRLPASFLGFHKELSVMNFKYYAELNTNLNDRGNPAFASHTDLLLKDITECLS